MQADRISHVASDPTLCINIKSRKEPKKQCTNAATHGEFCGIHFKHPRPWCPGSPASIAARVKDRKRTGRSKVDREASADAAKKILKCWRHYWVYAARRKHGPAYWYRQLCTNDCDFFSTEPLTDISGVTFYSYKDTDNHVYGFDIRSIHALLYRARISGEPALNPFTRSPFPTFVNKHVTHCVRSLAHWRLPTEWAPLTPPTPEQQLRMKIVDIFAKIDELNYYSSPDWFIDLDADGQRQFYNNLFNIWTHRANLSMAQKNTIVPGFAVRLFRTPRWALADMSLESLQKLNLGIMRQMITSAADRNDRILGAMYVVSTFTLVCDGARTAYPWLYESVVEEPAPPEARILHERRPALANLLGIGWLQELLALRDGLEAAAPDRAAAVPPLQLPPPAGGNPDVENS
jgi:hypothetical protein